MTKGAKKQASAKKAVAKKATKLAAKTVKKPAKPAPKPAATKVTKKAAPSKKPAAKPAAKPAVKAKAPEKKPAPVAVKSAAPAKKAPPPAPAKKDDKKPLPTKATAKKEVQDKVVAAPSKKPEAAAESKRPAATAAKAAAAPAPLKVEPKIIETPQMEMKKPIVQGDLFTADELQSFRVLLEDERNKILDKARRAVEEGGIQIERDDLMDEVDQAAAMEAQNLTFRLLDRDRKLLAEIDHAIAKLDTGEFGYCEGTGEPIPKRRLELRPWCRHSVKYKEKLERMKKSGRGVVDEDEL